MCTLATISRALIAEWKFWDYGFWAQASKATWLNHIYFACRFKRQIFRSTNCSEANLSMTGADKKKKKKNSSLSLSLACAPVHGVAWSGAWQESCHGVFLGHGIERCGAAFREVRAPGGGNAGRRAGGTGLPGCVPCSLQTTEATAAAARLLMGPHSYLCAACCSLRVASRHRLPAPSEAPGPWDPSAPSLPACLWEGGFRRRLPPPGSGSGSCERQHPPRLLRAPLPRGKIPSLKRCQRGRTTNNNNNKKLKLCHLQTTTTPGKEIK